MCLNSVMDRCDAILKDGIKIASSLYKDVHREKET